MPAVLSKDQVVRHKIFSEHKRLAQKFAKLVPLPGGQAHQGRWSRRKSLAFAPACP